MPRLIDADMLIDAMTGACNIFDAHGIDTTINRTLITIAEQAPTIATGINVPNKWISVKERLPEKGGKYLVTVTSNVDGKPFVKTAWFLRNLWDNWQFKYECEPNVPGFYNGDGEGDWVERTVTHWMPLPEPPKEETDGHKSI